MADLQQQQQGAATGLAASPSPQRNLQQAQPLQPQQAPQAHPLDPSVRLYLEAAAEQLIASQTADVLQRAAATAGERIRSSAVQAMVALTAPELGPAVIGTAAAVVAEVATAAAEQRLRAHVPSAVRRAATEQLQQLLAVAAKGGGGRAAAQGPLPAA